LTPALKRAADDKVAESPARRRVGRLLVLTPRPCRGSTCFLGVTPTAQDPAKAAPNHNPKFFVDEHALVVGVRTMARSQWNS
jgi:amidohydrolase